MLTAEINGIQMCYDDEGTGEPLILLHGALGVIDPAAPSGWSAPRPALAARYQTFALELRGHGRTGNPSGRLSYTALADDVAAFITNMNLAPVHLAGFSLGGELGLLLGMTRPELLRSLVCVGANYCLDEAARAALGLFDPALIERELPDFALDLAARHDPHHYPGYWRDLTRQIKTAAETALVWTADDLRRIPTPVLLVTGEADPFNGLEQALAMRRQIPRSELLVLNRAGMEGMDNHRVQATRAGIVAPVMLDFLARHS